MSHSDFSTSAAISSHHLPNSWKQGQLCVGKDIEVTLGKLMSASDFWATGVQGNIYQDHRILRLTSSAMNGLFRHLNQDTILFQEKQEVFLLLAGSEVGTSKKGSKTFKAKRQIVNI